MHAGQVAGQHRYLLVLRHLLVHRIGNSAAGQGSAQRLGDVRGPQRLSRKGANYLLRHGKTNFDEGALAHDCLAAVEQHGLVPEEVFSGLLEGATRHDHGEMVAVLKGMVEAFIQRSRPSARWDEAIGSVLDVYLGAAPPEFSYQDQSFTAKSFAAHVGFDPDQYVGLTSYTHHPFGESFVLEVPDNSSSGAFVNRPIDDLLEIVDRSLAAGFSVVWDGDVSERGFQARNGIAVWPAEGNNDFATRPGDEAAVTQEQRQASLEDFSTGEEHLMHLVGTARDQRGTKYYIIKNSWGEVGDHKGFLYMSENYFRAKTVAITVHRDALDAESATMTPTSGSGAASSSSSGTSQR